MASPVVVSRIQNRRGTQAQFDALYPVGYTGTGPVDQDTYPNILQPGELALCTDTRRIFVGNLSGEYVEIAISGAVTDLVFEPLSIQLAPAAVWTVIPQLTYTPTPFFKMMYSATDAPSANWNEVGTTFARNGELNITALTNPDTTLVDSSTDMNTYANTTNLVFKSQYDITGTQIEILYMHNITVTPNSVELNVGSIHWSPFI